MPHPGLACLGDTASQEEEEEEKVKFKTETVKTPVALGQCLLGEDSNRGGWPAVCCRRQELVLLD